MNTAKTTNGYVYVFSNKWFTGLYKIGCTKNVSNRRSTLGKTSVPDDFDVVFILEVENYKNAEKIIHKMLELFRYDPQREFFRAAKSDIKKVLITVAKSMNGVVYQGTKRNQVYPSIKKNI